MQILSVLVGTRIYLCLPTWTCRHRFYQGRIRRGYHRLLNITCLRVCRFDLLYLILDHVDEDADRRLAKHLVSLYLEDQLETAGVNVIVSLVWISRDSAVLLTGKN